MYGLIRESVKIRTCVTSCALNDEVLATKKVKLEQTIDAKRVPDTRIQTKIIVCFHRHFNVLGIIKLPRSVLCSLKYL